MKKKYTKIVLFVLINFSILFVFGQVPQAINFQAIARDGSGNPMVNTNLQIRLSVIDSLQGGTIVYQELRALQTNAYGSFSFQIGVNPSFVIVGTFSAINWGTGNKHLKIDYDPTNTFSFDLTLGIIKFVTVPYAFAAETVTFIDATGAQEGDALIYNQATGKFEPGQVSETQNLSDVLTLNNDANANQIKNLANPTDSMDAVTKVYVDALLARIEALEVSDLLNNGFYDTRDNSHYNVVKIGNQFWMAENLKYLPSVVGVGTESDTIPYHYVYGYDGTSVTAAKATSNYNTYGVLYNWMAAMAGSSSSSANPSGVQGACPSGWHLPSDAEWSQLTTFLGGENVAGGKLKEVGTTHWQHSAATNETGFTALPGGFAGVNNFVSIGQYGFWWSATAYDTSSSWDRDISFLYSNVTREYPVNERGLSVRCIKN